jgi:hypothetical protein
LMAVAVELSGILGAVSSVDDNVLADMTKLAEKAATLWLKFGSQLFRVLVVIPDHIRAPAQGGNGRMEQREPQELVLQPELRRIGNSSGEEFERDQIIADCRGVFTSFQSECERLR